MRFPLAVLFTVFTVLLGAPAHGQTFQAGFAQRDITPTEPVPMWGYGARHDALSTGVLDPLYAKAVVLSDGTDKLALVGLDLGRSPTEASMAVIRAAVIEQAGVEHLFLVGSHTHHGPVIELTDAPGCGADRFPAAVAYVKQLEQELIGVIAEAAGALEDAQVGWGRTQLEMNRNRHSKIEPKVTDPDLTVLRVDRADGSPLAILVNFAAHPTMLDAADLRFSAEYPGHMMRHVEAELGAPCVFLQGAAGDMSCRTTEDTRTIETFGRALGEHAAALAKSITTGVPETPELRSVTREFSFTPRVNISDPGIWEMYKLAFFPELFEAVRVEFTEGTIRPILTTALVNRQLGIVGGSGEFFSDHANRLKARSRADMTLFLGYCNGHHLYFPTIEGASEGGYGADATVSWVPLGAGEAMMNQALIDLYTLSNRFPDHAPSVMPGEELAVESAVAQ